MTKVINLSALVKEPLLALDIDGVKHNMAEPTVEKMLKQLQMIEELGMNPSPAKEIEAGIEMILDAFPTLTKEVVKTWSLSQVQAIVEAVRGIGGSVASDEEPVEGNVQKAS